MKSKKLIFSGWLLLVSAGFGLAERLALAANVGTSPVAKKGRVVRVVDGDTYDVLAGGRVRRVRLLGVDAPELSQPFGPQASDSVAALLRGRVVSLTYHGTDLYGRTLAAVRLPEAGRPALDSLLVARGWAWAWNPRRRVAGRAAEQAAAQQAGLGLWKCGPGVPPKLWRSFSASNKRRYRGSCTW